MVCEFLLSRDVIQLCVYIHPLFFVFPSHFVHQRALNRVELCSRFSLVVYFIHSINSVWGFPSGPVVEESACPCRKCGFDPWVEKISWRMKSQPTPVLLPGKSYGKRSLVGCSPWGHQRVRRLTEHACDSVYQRLNCDSESCEVAS